MDPDHRLLIDVERRYGRGPVVRARLELPLGAASITVLFGPSGSGKTTVLRALAGLDRPDAGVITFGGETWFDADRRTCLPPQARGVGLLFQEYALFPHLSVRANVGYGLHRLAASARAERVAELAERFGVADLLDRAPPQLSGGQRQRVALARALALGDRLAVLAGGAVRQVGPVHEVFSAPADVEVARVVGTENVFPARLARRQDGLVVVRTPATGAGGGAELVAIDPGGVEEEAYVCIRAEDVVLEPGHQAEAGHASSAQNRLAGVIVARRDEGPLARLTIDCGVRLVALVTRASADRLGFAPGGPAWAVVKAPGVRVVPRRA